MLGGILLARRWAWLLVVGGLAAGCVGVFPLHEAVRDRDNRRVELLIAGGAEVNARNLHGVSPLHIAAFQGDVTTVTLLLGAGARADARTDETGFTPLHFAGSAGSPEVAKPSASTYVRHPAC